MSALRQCLKNPASYLLILALAAGLAFADSFRAPQRQIVAKVYVGMVRGYQSIDHRTLGGLVRCRYSPTCSHYSVEAVQRYGMRKGLRLTLGRLWRCRSGVELGTMDPVP
jgi:putative membrane protein insertion efficiency factor